MIEKINKPASQTEGNNSFSQYLSHHFKENFEHLTDFTKDSINNFLKTIAEIEEEFIVVLKGQQLRNLEWQGFDLDHSGQYMEENY